MDHPGDGVQGTLVLILIALLGITVMLAIGITTLVHDQRVQICLDVPSYYKCDQWGVPG